MTKTNLTIVVLILTALVVFEFFSGSRWSFVASKDGVIYQHVDAPINTLPVVTRINRGDTVNVERCFFDKDDAYLLVKTHDGSVGYSFDILQPYKRSWNLVGLNYQAGAFDRGLTCWRLAGQFSRKR